jgi:hypothetical protein
MILKRPRLLIGLSLVITLSLAFVSYYGAFAPATYARDSSSMGAQGMGQDMFDLFVVVPLLVISLAFTLRNNRIAFLLFGGTVFYVLYSYFIYAFGVHFNSLFLLYCLILGTSLYGFLVAVFELKGMQVQHWFGNRAPVRATGAFFIVIALLFYLLWLKDVVPAIVGNSVPATVADDDLLVNPVHVLDIAVALPGLVITAILLFKKHELGYIFAPIYLVFTILVALALISMVFAMKAKGIGEDISTAGIFLILAAISTAFLYLFFRSTRVEGD